MHAVRGRRGAAGSGTQQKRPQPVAASPAQPPSTPFTRDVKTTKHKGSKFAAFLPPYYGEVVTDASAIRYWPSRTTTGRKSPRCEPN